MEIVHILILQLNICYKYASWAAGGCCANEGYGMTIIACWVCVAVPCARYKGCEAELNGCWGVPRVEIVNILIYSPTYATCVLAGQRVDTVPMKGMV